MLYSWDLVPRLGTTDVSIHNIYFCDDIKKYLYFSVEKNALSDAMSQELYK